MHAVNNALFTPEKTDIGLFQRVESMTFRFISITFRGPTPFNGSATVFLKTFQEKSLFALFIYTLFKHSKKGGAFPTLLVKMNINFKYERINWQAAHITDRR